MLINKHVKRFSLPGSLFPQPGTRKIPDHKILFDEPL